MTDKVTVSVPSLKPLRRTFRQPGTTHIRSSLGFEAYHTDSETSGGVCDLNDPQFEPVANALNLCTEFMSQQLRNRECYYQVPIFNKDVGEGEDENPQKRKRRKTKKI